MAAALLPQAQGNFAEKTYSSRTLIGNYSEEIALKDDQIRSYISCRDSPAGTLNQTAGQRVASRMRRHLQAVTITPQHDDGFLRFGDYVMVQNALNEGYLSVDMDDTISSHKFGVTTTTAPTPLNRNVFQLTKVDTPQMKMELDRYRARKESEILHFGQQFRFSNVTLDEQKYHLHTEACSPSSFSRMTRNQQVSMVPMATFDTVWKAVAPELAKRDSAEGRPVKANSVLVLTHGKTNVNLSSSKVGYSNSFGSEWEVCSKVSRTRLSKHGQEDLNPDDFWAIVTAPTGSHAADLRDQAYGDSGGLLQRVRRKFLERAGNGGYRSLVRVLTIMDDCGDKRLSKEELVEGLQTYGIFLDNQEAATLMRDQDRDGSGCISITEFLRSLKGPINQRRRSIVLQAYSMLDRNQDNTVNMVDLKLAYGLGLNQHPQVQSGEKSKEQVLLEFSSSWDADENGVITREEFIDYYTDLSVTIDSDDYFELMVRNAWHISGGEGVCENTSNRRVLVIHRDGSQTVQEIENDLGVDETDLPEMRRRLEMQGVRDIKQIKLYG